MAEPFADKAYYEENFGSPPSAIASRLDQELARASRLVRREMKRCGVDVDADITSGRLDGDLVADIVCEMVKAAGASPGGVGVASIQTGAGPYQETQNFSNPAGDMYMSKKQKRLLGCGGQRAWEYDPFAAVEGSS